MESFFAKLTVVSEFPTNRILTKEKLNWFVINHMTNNKHNSRVFLCM